MSDAMMAWGSFVFSLPTAVYDVMQRRMSWSWSKTPRMYARDATQFTGPGDETINVSGSIVPQVAGDVSSLDLLRDMADSGEPQPLVGGDGSVFGVYALRTIDENRAHFWPDGSGRKYDFALEFVRTDDDALAETEEEAPEPTEAEGDEP